MPKKRPSSTAPTNTYESDNGFVEDAPKSKKPKTTRKAQASSADAKAVGGRDVGKDGEVFWELSGKRRIGVQEFKGTRMINIREYYEKDGEMLPGKKGISLPVEQFNTIISLLPQIETALTEKGEKICRPDYSGAGASAGAEMEEDEDGDAEPAIKGKKNFEETSDEEE